MSLHVDRAAPSTEGRVGEVLRHVRERSGLSLRTLAARAGFSASFLSQVETGQVSPSVASLERIATELGITLADLFEASQDSTTTVVRAGERVGFTSSWSRARVESLIPAGKRRPLEAIAVTLAPRGASGKHAGRHPADQFAYVLRGPIRLLLGDEDLCLSTGDAVVIPRRTPHRWYNEGPGTAEVLLASIRLTQ